MTEIKFDEEAKHGKYYRINVPEDYYGFKKGDIGIGIRSSTGVLVRVPGRYSLSAQRPYVHFGNLQYLQEVSKELFTVSLGRFNSNVGRKVSFNYLGESVTFGTIVWSDDKDHLVEIDESCGSKGWTIDVGCPSHVAEGKQLKAGKRYWSVNDQDILPTEKSAGMKLASVPTPKPSTFTVGEWISRSREDSSYYPDPEVIDEKPYQLIALQSVVGSLYGAIKSESGCRYECTLLFGGKATRWTKCPPPASLVSQTGRVTSGQPPQQPQSVGVFKARPAIKGDKGLKMLDPVSPLAPPTQPPRCRVLVKLIK